MRPGFRLPVWARTLMLAAAIETAAVTAWAQVPHIPGMIPGTIPGDVAGMAGSAQAAAAMMHFAQMLKHFDQNGNGQLDPNEMGLAKSGLGGLLGQGGNAAGGGGNLLPIFDRNGNGQLDTVEMEMAQVMMAMLVAGYTRPVGAVPPMAMPMQGPAGQFDPPPQPAKRGRRKRGERIADFAKANNAPAAPKAAAKKKNARNVKARAPMVEPNQPQGAKAGAAAAPAND